MGCSTCSTGSCGSSSSSGASGCGSKGNCSCNRLNTYDWLSDIKLPSFEEFNIVEISFKNGSRKGFFLNPGYFQVNKGDDVVVESGTGYDIGRISLTGELVKLQMKKKRFKDPALVASIIRRANERDLERQDDARKVEPQAIVRARAIVRNLNLDMKIGDVEFQGDKRKATFYYTADGRVDFRELIKLFAKDFRVKIEMRQIGARQESARIGGIGSCGRELCCSTWLSDFKSVSTAAARYQNLAINQAKLSGQCGRLKCCLNFELDTYMDALEDFPTKAEKLETEAGLAVLMKTDIFKKTMFYTYKKEGFSKIYPLKVERVKEILALNKNGERPLELAGIAILDLDAEIEPDFGDVTGSIELADLDRHKKPRRKRNRNRIRKNDGQDGSNNRPDANNRNKSNDRRPPSNNRSGNNSNNSNNSSSQGNSSNRNSGGNRSRNTNNESSSNRINEGSKGKNSNANKPSDSNNPNRTNNRNTKAGNENRSNQQRNKPKPPSKRPVSPKRDAPRDDNSADKLKKEGNRFKGDNSKNTGDDKPLRSNIKKLSNSIFKNKNKPSDQDTPKQQPRNENKSENTPNPNQDKKRKFRPKKRDNNDNGGNNPDSNNQ